MGHSILVDGAKRDRTVWPGDMGIALPTALVSTGDLLPARNALETLFDYQDPTTGALPECGPPLLKRGSDTYHLWTLIGTARYLLYSGDVDWVRTIWPRYRRALDFSLKQIDANGLMGVTGVRDWGRLGQGGENLEANVLLYETLRSGREVALAAGDQAAAASYGDAATRLRSAIDDRLWDRTAGAYRDAPGKDLHPQDGNAMAIWFGMTADPDRVRSILYLLAGRWNRFGALSAELPDTIAPFAGSMEVMARFQAHDDAGAPALIRREWGYMIEDPDGTRSTFLEGYLADGTLGYRRAYGYLNDSSYVSHAQGWSTGPTSALTFYVLGLQPLAGASRQWLLAPHPGDLVSAEGAFSTKLGVFRAAWRGAGQDGLHWLRVATLADTSGRIVLPPGTQAARILLDGHILPGYEVMGGIAMTGGVHTVLVDPVSARP